MIIWDKNWISLRLVVSSSSLIDTHWGDQWVWNIGGAHNEQYCGVKFRWKFGVGGRSKLQIVEVVGIMTDRF